MECSNGCRLLIRERTTRGVRKEWCPTGTGCRCLRTSTLLFASCIHASRLESAGGFAPLPQAHESGNLRITQQKIDFLHLPIIDGNVTTDSALNRLAVDVMERVLRGEKLYIHCWGGHGRTGTLVAVMLGRLYGLPYTTALRYTQAFHDARVYPQGVRSPQTPVQRAQVRPSSLRPSDFRSCCHCSATAAADTPPSCLKPSCVPVVWEQLSRCSSSPVYSVYGVSGFLCFCRLHVCMCI